MCEFIQGGLGPAQLCTDPLALHSPPLPAPGCGPTPGQRRRWTQPGHALQQQAALGKHRPVRHTSTRPTQLLHLHEACTQADPGVRAGTARARGDGRVSEAPQCSTPRCSPAKCYIKKSPSTHQHGLAASVPLGPASRPCLQGNAQGWAFLSHCLWAGAFSGTCRSLLRSGGTC